MKMLRLFRVGIGRIAAPLPHDESPMAVALKQDEQVTGLKIRRPDRRHLSALMAYVKPYVTRRSTRGAVKNNSLEKRSLLR